MPSSRDDLDSHAKELAIHPQPAEDRPAQEEDGDTSFQIGQLDSEDDQAEVVPQPHPPKAKL